MGVDGGEHHEQRAQNGQNGHHGALEGGQRLFLHQRDVNGDIQRVQSDDGQLRGVELEGAEAFHNGAAVEIQQPQRAHQQAEHGGVGGHAGGFIHVLEAGQLLVFAVSSQIVHGTGHGHGQTVAGTPAGNDHEHENQSAAYLTEDVLERHLGAGLAAFHHNGGLHSAGQTDIVNNVYDGHDHGADQQGPGQVPLGILQLGADGSGADPALEREGQRHDSAEQSGAEGHLSDHMAEVELGHAVGQAHDGAHDGHQEQRDQLDDGGGHSELARQLGSQSVHGIGDHHEYAGQHHGAAAHHGVVPAHQHAEIAGRQPAEHGYQRGIIDDGHEPADVIAEVLAAGSLRKAHQTIHALVVAGDDAKGVSADDHDDAHDDERENTNAQITAGLCQDSFCLEKDTGTDDSAHHQRNGDRQVIPFFHSNYFPFSLSLIVNKIVFLFTIHVCEYTMSFLRFQALFSLQK